MLKETCLIIFLQHGVPETTCFYVTVCRKRYFSHEFLTRVGIFLRVFDRHFHENTSHVSHNGAPAAHWGEAAGKKRREGKAAKEKLSSKVSC